MTSVDVIVPCYRYGQYLRTCVESVLKQSHPKVRVLILDDASPDNTAEVAGELVREDPRVELVRHPQNKGHIATYNEGIDWASADYLLLLSADDYLLPGSLERAASFLNSHSDVGFVYGRILELQNGRLATYETQVMRQLRMSESDSRIFSGREFVELSGRENQVATPTAIVRTALQKHVGGYKACFPHAGDFELWLRLAAHGSVGFLGAHQAVYRLHHGNMSRAFFSRSFLPDLLERRAVVESFFEGDGQRLPGHGELRQQVLRELAISALGHASGAFNENESELSAEIEQLALSIYPDARNTFAWKKLSFKRRIGAHRWHAIRPLLASLRRLRRT
jgi:glycosyltransferase involved in cell wall biosynthesis